jgi:hypothetical protein
MSCEEDDVFRARASICTLEGRDDAVAIPSPVPHDSLIFRDR